MIDFMHPARSGQAAAVLPAHDIGGELEMVLQHIEEANGIPCKNICGVWRIENGRLWVKYCQRAA